MSCGTRGVSSWRWTASSTRWAQNIVGDALRQNAVTLTNATVLRLPLLGLRVAADEFFAQIEEALGARGYAA